MKECRACSSIVKSALDNCDKCGCPFDLPFWQVKNWDLIKRRMKPREPSIIGFPELMPAAKCPNCSMRMYVEDLECPHCKYELSAEEKQTQVKWSRSQKLKGIKLGLIFTIIFIIIFTAIFSV